MWGCGRQGHVYKGRQLASVLKQHTDAQRMSFLSHLLRSVWATLGHENVEPTQCCRTSSLYFCVSSCSLTQLLPDSTDTNSHTVKTSSVSFSFPNIQIKKFFPLSNQYRAVKPMGANAFRSLNSYSPWQAFIMALAVPSFRIPLHTRCPHLPHLVKESSSVGRTLASRRFNRVPRWLHL